jgi:hypothetical protein
MTRPARLLVAALIAAATLTSCVSMPVDGPLVEVGEAGANRTADPADIIVQPPAAGESPTDIVVHFLDAMTASPISTSVASEYLTAAAAADWKPEHEIITYADKTRPFGTGPLQVSLIDANHLDSRGSWRGALPEKRSTLRFPMALEDGEWRIARAPNALIVPDPWFEPRFQQVSLYYFDFTGSVVVPEPVFLPRGDQLPTLLTSNLLLGPPRGLEQVYRTFFPPGMTAGMSVPVTRSGVANIELQGDDSLLTPQTTGLMLAQLTWTLRQVPDIEALRVSIGGDVVDVPGEAEVLPVTAGAEYDPTGALSSGDLFALREGLLVRGQIDALQAVDGPMGREEQGARAVAVTPDGVRVAGVTGSGRVLVSRVTSDGQRVRQVLSGGNDLLTPGWDLTGRLWVVDRTRSGALVSVVRAGRAQPITVPGLTGQRVRTFIVSRDGTRLVAVLIGRGGDSVVVSRIGTDGSGALVATRVRPILSTGESPVRITDLGWKTPTSLMLLSRLTGGLSQVSVLSLDGSPNLGQPPPSTLRGRMRSLVSSPVESQATYAVSRSGVVDLATAPITERPEGVALGTLTYPG